MDRKYDILVAGEVNPDLILTSPELEPRFNQVETLVDEATLTIGASAAIFACGACRLGLKWRSAELSAKIFLAASCSKCWKGAVGCLAGNHRSGPTHGVNRDFEPDHRPGDIDLYRRYCSPCAPSILLIACWHPSGTCMWRVISSSPTSSLGCRIFLPGRTGAELPPSRYELGSDGKLDWSEGAARPCRRFLPNENEALSITRAATIEAAASELAAYGPIVAVKMGQAGGMVYQSGKIFGARRSRLKSRIRLEQATFSTPAFFTAICTVGAHRARLSWRSFVALYLQAGMEGCGKATLLVRGQKVPVRGLSWYLFGQKWFVEGLVAGSVK